VQVTYELEKEKEWLFQTLARIYTSTRLRPYIIQLFIISPQRQPTSIAFDRVSNITRKRLSRRPEAFRIQSAVALESRLEFGDKLIENQHHHVKTAAYSQLRFE